MIKLTFTAPASEESDRQMDLIALILPTLDTPIWFIRVTRANTQPTLSTESRSVPLTEDLDLEALRLILEDLTQP
jgi:hypothetical protein